MMPNRYPRVNAAVAEAKNATGHAVQKAAFRARNPAAEATEAVVETSAVQRPNARHADGVKPLSPSG